MNIKKSRVKQLLNTGFFHIFSSNVINKIVTFCSSFILVRILTKYDYGVYSFAFNIISIFMLFSGLGTIPALLQYGSESQGELNKAYFKFGYKIGFTFDILMAIFLIIFSLFCELKFYDAKYLILILAFIPLIIYIKDFIQIFLRTELRNKAFSYLNTLNSVILLLMTVIGAILYQSYGVAIFQYIAYMLTSIIGLFVAKDIIYIFKSKFKLNKLQKIAFMKYSIVISLNNALSQLLYVIDTFLIGFFIVDAMVIASYKSATLIPIGLSFIPASIITYIYPYFARHNTDIKWIREKYYLMIKALAVINLIITTILVLFAPLIIEILFGSEYLDSVATFRILSIGYFFAGTFRIPGGNILIIMKKLKFNFYVGIITSVLNVILDIVFIYYWGIIGAAIATTLVYLVTSLCSNIYIYNLLKKS